MSELTVPQGALNALIRSLTPGPLVIGTPLRCNSVESPARVGSFVADRPMRLVRVVGTGTVVRGEMPWRLSVRLADGTALAEGQLPTGVGLVVLTLADLEIPAGSVVECAADAPAGAGALDAPSFTLTWVPA